MSVSLSLSLSSPTLALPLALSASPLSACSIQPQLVVWMRGADHPGEKWGRSHYPQKCKGPTKGSGDIGVRERGWQGEMEKQESTWKSALVRGGGDWLGWGDERMDKEKWRWERDGRGSWMKTLILFFLINTSIQLSTWSTHSRHTCPLEGRTLNQMTRIFALMYKYFAKTQ